MFGGRGEFTLGPYSNRTFYLFIYIYIYKTEAFEAPTIFHVSTTFIYIYNILKKRNKVSTTFKKKKQTLKTIKPKKKKKRNTNNPILLMLWKTDTSKKKISLSHISLTTISFPPKPKTRIISLLISDHLNYFPLILDLTISFKLFGSGSGFDLRNRKPTDMVYHIFPAIFRGSHPSTMSVSNTPNPARQNRPKGNY